MADRLFISYRREDTKWAAGLIYQHLVAKFGRKHVFMDVSSLEGGTDYLRTIRETVAACDVCVALIGDKWWSAADASGARRLDDSTDLLRIEIASALRENVTVIPCMFEEAKLPSEDQLPEDLRPLVTRQQVHIAHSSLDRDIEALVTAIREAFARKKHERREARLQHFRQQFILPLSAFGRRKPVLVTAATVLLLAACVAGVYAFNSRPFFAARMLLGSRPEAISKVWLPARGPSNPSPADWRDEVLYYVLPDRFSDGNEAGRTVLDAMNPKSARKANWDAHAALLSGTNRWQGGTLVGVRSKLGYLKDLGVSAILLASVLKQRRISPQGETYFGFSVQDFLDVDPHLGSRRDLVDLVSEAHSRGIRVILSAPVISETGPNWLYQKSGPSSTLSPPPGGTTYPFGSWLNGDGKSIDKPTHPDDGVWPREFQNPEAYERRGGSSFDPTTRNDFPGLRRLKFSVVWQDLAAVYNYWIALTDCDGLYLDSLWQVGMNDARDFTQQIKQFAASLGKTGFLLIGDASYNADVQYQYLSNLDPALDAVLDFNATNIRDVAKGFRPPGDFFEAFFSSSKSEMAGNRASGKRTLAMITNPDGFPGRGRFSVGDASLHQIVAATAFQLFTPGLPCLYYGDEEALANDPADYPQNYGSTVFLREAMFGPVHPKKLGAEGLKKGETGLDSSLPGFGPYGVPGVQAFNEGHPAYVRIAALLGARRKYAALRSGILEVEQVRSGGPFHFSLARELTAWSRSVGRKGEGVLSVVNLNGTDSRSADVKVNPDVYPPGSKLTVVANTAHAAEGKTYKGTHPIASQLDVKSDGGDTYVEIRDLGPSEVLVLAGNPVTEDTAFGRYASNFQQNPYGYGSGSYYPPRRTR
jgi:glycosidase